MSAIAAPAARAEICASDPVPAATLLLPYFEVDLLHSAGRTTLFSINNASASATLVHVTLWTDEAIPTLNFDLYLTGYDVQTINLRDLFVGRLPVTAPLGRDPGDAVSHKGFLSEDASFPGCEALPYALPALDAARQESLRAAHTGKNATLYGGCLGANYGDEVARGYATVDVVTRCSTLDPSRAGYFTGVASDRNTLWGNYSYVDPGHASAIGEPLVHIESCARPSVGNGAGRCPFAADAPTFYGRYATVAGKDQREPLASAYGGEFVLGGAFSGGTDMIVWRDIRVLPTGVNGPHPCNVFPPWFPFEARDVVAFDEQENAYDLCVRSENFDPPLGGTVSCFPLATQRIHVGGENLIAYDPFVPWDFGWIYVNLQGMHDLPGTRQVAQAWVSFAESGAQQYGVSFDAVQLANGCDAVSPGGVLIP